MRLLILVVMVLTAGCNVFENEQSVPKELQGEWNWYRTAGGWGTSVEADSVDYSMTLKIYAQNNAEWYKDDSLVQKYNIVQGQDESIKGDLVMFRRDEKSDNADCGLKIDYHPEINELHLPTALCEDVPTYYFNRK